MSWIEREWADRGLDLETSPIEPGEPEIDALENGALLVPLRDSGALALSGADRIDFLHGQISNDVRGLRTGETNRSLLLNHRGHALAELTVFRREEEIVVVVDGGGLEVVEESLRRHIIFDQVELSRLERALLLTVQGAAASETVRQALGVELPAVGEFLEVAGDGGRQLLATAGRSAAGGFDLLVPEGDLPRIVEALKAAGAVPGGRPALELGRVRAGIASAAAEAGEGVLPQEAGLEPLVSYRKGCYLGQEIMARIEARGKLRRELACLSLDDMPEPNQREIESDGRKVGQLGRLVRDPQLGLLALAVLRGDLTGEAELAVGGVGARRMPMPVVGSPVTR